MAHTVANVPVAGRAYTVLGVHRQTVTDVTVDSNSEVVTAAELGLSAVFDAEAEVNTGQATDTGTYAKATVSSSSNSITLAEFTAAGVAATTAAATVIRVRAKGY